MKTMLYSVVMLIILFVSGLEAKDNKTEVFQKLKAKYAKANSIVVRFEIGGSNFLLKASKNGKFFINNGESKIYSDGKITQNVNTKTKKVVIDNLPESNTALTIEKIFFNIWTKGKPVDIKEMNGETKLTVKCDGIVSGLSDINFTINSNNEISEITLNYNGKLEIIKILSYVINNKMNDKTFTFTPPSDYEVIDLR